jgi:ubiquinone/menaquinone biosynthesis C-methylase UbiE
MVASIGLKHFFVNMESNKAFYRQHEDSIWEKRVLSPYPIRAHAHKAQNRAILAHTAPEETVLDAGCGQGVLAISLAEEGRRVVGVDISAPNIDRARIEAGRRGLDASRLQFAIGDAEALPFGDRSFDVVVSSHVLEHLPCFDKGFEELCRVARKRIIIALPTGFNLCALALLGRDHGYWKFSKRSFFAIPWGIVRTIANLHREGVQEGYAGHNELPHIWRFPWVVRRRLAHPEWKITCYEASTLCLPYFSFLLPAVRWLERYRDSSWLRYFGYGTTVTLERIF